MHSTIETFRKPRFVTCDPENYAPDVDPTKSRVAFGRLAIPKLVSKTEVSTFLTFNTINYGYDRNKIKTRTEDKITIRIIAYPASSYGKEQ